MSIEVIEMIDIFITIENDFLTSWGSTPSGVKNELKLTVAKDHEVLRNPEIFKYIDGELIKDEERQLQLIEENQEGPSEIERLRQENEMLAMAVMELTASIMKGGD